MPLNPEKMMQMTDLAGEVMRPVLMVASRRLVQSMEEVHDSEIKPLRDALTDAVSALEDAEAVIDADDQPEVFGKVSAARKQAQRMLEN